MAASSWFGFHDYCMNDGILEELHSFYIFLQYRLQTCLSKDSANPQHSISARWLKIFSKSKDPTPEKAKKIGFRIHGRRNDRLFFYCCSPFTDIFIDLRFRDFDKIGKIWKNSLTMEKISNKISSNFGVSPPHFSAMVFESLMGSAWAVIWLGRGKWAKRPTQLGGFHHVSPRSLGRWMIPFDEHITYGVVQPPPRQFGTLQVSSCTVSLQILCIVCSDVMSLFSPVFSSLFFFLG